MLAGVGDRMQAMGHALSMVGQIQVPVIAKVRRRPGESWCSFRARQRMATQQRRMRRRRKLPTHRLVPWHALIPRVNLNHVQVKSPNSQAIRFRAHGWGKAAALQEWRDEWRGHEDEQ